MEYGEHREYVTPEDYGIALKNGIHEKLVADRVYRNGWSVKRAITQPVKRKRPKNWSKWVRVAELHGIGKLTFANRVDSGMSLTIAATYPKGKTGVKPKFSEKTIKKAEENGVSRTTFLNRVNTRNWSVKDAIYTPINKK